MGGQDGARGYLYQAFACVLEMLTISSWEKTHIEFKTENDKVDIAFENSEGVIKAIQVKSSKNLFNKTEMITWISDLIQDCKADEYQLFLIGSVNESGNKLIKSLKKYQDDNLDKESRQCLKNVDEKILEKKVQITLIPFEEEILQSIVRDKVHKYVSNKTAIIEYEGLVMISHSINMNMMLLSSKSEGITKGELDKEVFTWLKTVTGSFMKIIKEAPEYIVGVYNDTTEEVLTKSKQMKLIKFENYLNYIENEKTLLEEYIKKLQSMKLKKHKKSVLSDGNFLSPYSFDEIEYLEFDDEIKNQFVTYIKKFTKIKFDESIFYLDDLKSSTNKRNRIQNSELIGSDIAIEKSNLIITLKNTIMNLLALDTFMKNIGDVQILKIAIKNIGTLTDSNLRIQLFIPKNIGLYNIKLYPEKEEKTSFIENLVKDEGIFDKIFEVI